jgi:hypothetical protein
MAKSRSTPTPTRPFVRYLAHGSGNGNGNGNGAPPHETDAERLAHVEGLLVRVQSVLETQFLRMADMQVLIDRLNAERNRSR